jgi:hyperosmotically inducible periplasmic protein
MNIERKAVPALMAGILLTLGTSGCAWWNEHMRSHTASNATSEHRGPAQTASDAAITAKVKTAMAADELVKARHIDVDTLRGVVSLDGTVDSTAEKARAMEIARNVSGVVDVRDNLKTSG